MEAGDGKVGCAVVLGVGSAQVVRNVKTGRGCEGDWRKSCNIKDRLHKLMADRIGKYWVYSE